MYWRNLKSNDYVRETATGWVTHEGSVIDWQYHERLEAYDFLRKRAKGDAGAFEMLPCRICSKPTIRHAQYCWDGGLICSRECRDSMFTKCPNCGDNRFKTTLERNRTMHKDAFNGCDKCRDKHYGLVVVTIRFN